MWKVMTRLIGRRLGHISAYWPRRPSDTRLGCGVPRWARHRCGLRSGAMNGDRPFKFRRRAKAMITASVMALGLISFGQHLLAAVKKKPPAIKRPNVMAQIGAALGGKGAAKQAWAIKRIGKILASNPGNFALQRDLAFNWLRALARDGDYKAVVAIVGEAIVDNPGSTAFIDKWQADRIQALLAMDRTNAALRNAKSLFNFATIQDTPMAIVLVNECLLAQKPDGSTLAREFRQEQFMGSQPPGPGQKPKKCMVLEGITVNAKPYSACIRRIAGVGLPALIAKGDLWLLADSPTRAMKCFRQAYEIAAPRQLPMVCDRIAAAMRAKYGTIGPANAWLESIAR
jgi:hypothetical protein